MDNFEKFFWAGVIAVGIWAAVTPGRQFPSAVPARYRVKLPPAVIVLMFLYLGYTLFIKK